MLPDLWKQKMQKPYRLYHRTSKLRLSRAEKAARRRFQIEERERKRLDVEGKVKKRGKKSGLDFQEYYQQFNLSGPSGNMFVLIVATMNFG